MAKDNRHLSVFRACPIRRTNISLSKKIVSMPGIEPGVTGRKPIVLPTTLRRTISTFNLSNNKTIIIKYGTRHFWSHKPASKNK